MKFTLILITVSLLIWPFHTNAQVLYGDFGDSAKTIVDFNNDYDQPFAGSFDYLNRSITMGRIYSGATWNTGLMRLDAYGYPDNTFSGDGKAVYPDFSISNTVAVQSDGKILVGGDITGSDNTTDFHIFRTLENGDIDTAFGSNGSLILNLLPQQNESLLCLSVQSDGKILAGGFTGESNNKRMILVRLNNDGSIDNTFASLGIYYPCAFTDSEQLIRIESGSDNSIYLLLNGIENNVASGTVIKLNSNGNDDTSFATNGVADLLEMGYTINVSHIAILSNNNIEIAGNITVPQNGGCKIVLDLNGLPDPGFGVNGAAIISGPSDISILSSQTQANGKSVLLGLTTELVLIRLNADGTMDASFGTNGIFTPHFSGGLDLGVTAKIFTDDKITVIAGAYGFSADFMVGCVLLNEGNSVAETTTEQLTIYPNPCKNSFIVSTNLIGLNQIEIFDVSGKVIFTSQINSLNRNYSVDLPGHISPGLYFVSLKGNSSQRTTSIIIQ
jgi:uncharacterized delta-60 repeat protein